MQRDDICALQELLFRHICQPQLLQLLILIQIMRNDGSPKALHEQVLLIMQPLQLQSQLDCASWGRLKCTWFQSPACAGRLR